MDKLDELKQENQELREEIKKLKLFRGEQQKKGMIEKAKKGNLVSRIAFGYKLEFGKMVKDQEKAKKVQDIFEDFLKLNISLNKLSRKYNLSVNGIKKILKNYTYIGKIKFGGEIHQGFHEPLISSTIFNHVQDKLEKISKKKLSSLN